LAKPRSKSAETGSTSTYAVPPAKACPGTLLLRAQAGLRHLLLQQNGILLSRRSAGPHRGLLELSMNPAADTAHYYAVAEHDADRIRSSIKRTLSRCRQSAKVLNWQGLV